MNGKDISVPKTKKHNDIIVFRMMMFAMMLLMWGADLTDTVATTSLPWEMVTHELCAPPSPLHPPPPIRLFNWPFNLSAGRCQLYGRKNLHEKKGRLIGVLPTRVGPEFGCSIFWIGNVCLLYTSIPHALLISLDLYPIWQRPPINSMHQTLIGSILPEKLSSFHGDATQNLGQCVHYESPKLRDRNLSSSSSQLTIMIQINQNWASCGGPGTQLRIAPPKWSPFLQSLQAHWRQKRWQNLSRFGAIFHPDYGLINALQKLISSKRQC